MKMMKDVFKRREIKYVLTTKQAALLQQIASKYMVEDKFGRSNVKSIYFDTANHVLIRRSLEKPLYKEKFRIRFYGKAGAGDDVFLEIKKKLKHVVYKRRVKLEYQEALDFMAGKNDKQVVENKGPKELQILKELQYARDFYGGLVQSAYIEYDRIALAGIEDKNLRLTFDCNICMISQDSNSGKSKSHRILPEGKVLLEVKTLNGLPLWLREFIGKEHITKGSFSKYGEAYRKYIKGSSDYAVFEERRVG